jgi:hypothetical protein
MLSTVQAANCPPEPGGSFLLELIKGANLALRFLLELCALGALGYWGFKTGGGAIAKITLGVGAPLVAAVVWGTFLSPRAPVALPGLLVLVLQALVFASAAAGLVATGHRTLALVFGVVVVVNAVLLYAWGQ